jgi:predicted anti-sigma-YlaC factor YlaD
VVALRSEKSSLASELQAARAEASQLAAQLDEARQEVAAARSLLPDELAAALEEAREAAAQERRRSAVLEQAWSAAQEVRVFVRVFVVCVGGGGGTARTVGPVGGQAVAPHCLALTLPAASCEPSSPACAPAVSLMGPPDPPQNSSPLTHSMPTAARIHPHMHPPSATLPS